MNNIEFTYFDKEDNHCYQSELLTFLNVNEDNIMNTIDSIYSTINFDLSSIYHLLLKDKHMRFFNNEYLFLFLFSYDYLYLFGPLLYSILHHLDYQPHYDKLLQKLNNI